jgi:hypothetical protein
MMVSLLGTLLSGCNNDAAEQQVRVGSGISLSPPAISWQVKGNYDLQGNCVIDENDYNDTYMTVRATNENGMPLGGIDLRITADLTGNSYTGPAVVRIYDDINSNGVAEDNEQVLAPGMAAFDTRTGPYDGEAHFIARINLSCNYRSTIYVAGSPGGAATTIHVTTDSAPGTDDTDPDEAGNPADGDDSADSTGGA